MEIVSLITCVLYIIVGLWVGRTYIVIRPTYSKIEKLLIIIMSIALWPFLIGYELWQWLNN